MAKPIKLAEKLSNIHALAASLRESSVGDLNVLASVFDGLKQLSPDVTTQGIAEAGRFYAESLSNELDASASELLELIAAVIEEAEGRAQ
jgi:hypothetical protein